MKHWTHEMNGVLYVMPPEVSEEMPPDYREDPLAYYSEFCVGYVYEGKACSFWELATCPVNDDSDVIQVVLALAAAEIACNM